MMMMNLYKCMMIMIFSISKQWRNPREGEYTGNKQFRPVVSPQTHKKTRRHCLVSFWLCFKLLLTQILHTASITRRIIFSQNNNPKTSPHNSHSPEFPLEAHARTDNSKLPSSSQLQGKSKHERIKPNFPSPLKEI